MANKSPVGTYLAEIGAAALAIGAFLPWVKVTAPFVGTVTRSGAEGGDGWITAGLGVAIGALILVALNSSSVWPPRVAIGLGFLVGAVVVYEFVDVAHLVAKSDARLVATRFGEGLYLSGAGAVLSLIGSILAADATDSRIDDAVVSTPR